MGSKKLRLFRKNHAIIKALEEHDKRIQEKHDSLKPASTLSDPLYSLKWRINILTNKVNDVESDLLLGNRPENVPYGMETALMIVEELMLSGNAYDLAVKKARLISAQSPDKHRALVSLCSG